MCIFDIDDNTNNVDKNVIEYALTLQLSEEIAKNINENIIKHIFTNLLYKDINKNINDEYIR